MVRVFQVFPVTALILAMAMSFANAARLPSVTVWTNPATAVKTTLSEDWIVLPHGWNQNGLIPETSYTHVFINARTGIVGSYDCDDAGTDKTLVQYSDTVQAQEGGIAWDGPLLPVPDVKVWNLWSANGYNREGMQPVTMFASKIGSIFCNIIYTDMRDPTLRLVDHPELTTAIFGTARGEQPAPFVNPRTGVPVVVPDGWRYLPDAFVPFPFARFGMLVNDDTTELGQYGCEKQPDIAHAADFADQAMGYVSNINWDTSSQQQIGSDMVQIWGDVGISDGNRAATSMIVVKVKETVCTFVYRFETAEPDPARLAIFTRAIFGEDASTTPFDPTSKREPVAGGRVR